MKLRLKIPIPENSNVFTENGDKSVDLLIYEVEQLEVLEEVRIDPKTVHFNVKDGQFVNKGDIIFTEGFLGHKAMISDFNGIIEIKKENCRILGQKRHFERRISFDGTVRRVVPDRFIEISCNTTVLKPVFYTNFKSRLSDLIYYENKDDISREHFRSAGPDSTVFINDNLYVEELAKIIAFGVKRIIVNAIYVSDLNSLRREIEKLEGLAVMSGFGEIMGKKAVLISPKHNIFWGKKNLLVSDKVVQTANQVYEHPFWGISGEFKKKNELVGNLDYNREVFEFYLKNIENNV